MKLRGRGTTPSYSYTGKQFRHVCAAVKGMVFRQVGLGKAIEITQI